MQTNERPINRLFDLAENIIKTEIAPQLGNLKLRDNYIGSVKYNYYDEGDDLLVFSMEPTVDTIIQPFNIKRDYDKILNYYVRHSIEFAKAAILLGDEFKLEIYLNKTNDGLIIKPMK